MKSNIDGLRQGIDTLDHSVISVGRLNSQLASMKVMTSRTQKELKMHKQIRAVDIASRNISAILRRIEDYNSVPKRARRLMLALVETPNAIVTVYRATQDLEDWKDEIVREVKRGVEKPKRCAIFFFFSFFFFLLNCCCGPSACLNPLSIVVSSHAISSAPTILLPNPSHGRSSLPGVHYQHTPQVHEQVISVLGEHFEVVHELSLQIRKVVIANISNCFDLAVDSPALLVRSAEVMVLIEMKNARKYDHMPEDVRENMPDFVGTFEADVIESLKGAFSSRIQVQFTSYTFQAADEGKTGLEATLGAATRGIVDMTILRNDVAPCFPSNFDIIKIYREQLEEYMLPQVEALYSRETSTLEMADILKMASWMFHYNQQIVRNRAGEICTAFDKAVNSLMNEYVQQTSEQTRSWFQNIERRNSEVFPDSDGCLVTRDPEDMLNIVNMQISVARDQLPLELSHVAIKSYVVELKAAQLRLSDDLDGSWKHADIEKICAIINDSSRLQDKCEMLLKPEDNEAVDLVNSMAALCTGYIQLAIEATKLVACSVMEDLSEPVLSKVFSIQWEEGEDFARVTTKTLRDYFGDLKKWLPDYFFSKLVRECYQQTVSAYVEAIASKRVKPFRSKAVASQQMIKDKFAFHDLFIREYKDKLLAAGMRKDGEVEAPLDLLGALSKIILASLPAEVETELAQVQLHLGSKGAACVSHITALKKLDKEGAEEWNAEMKKLSNSEA